jgi:hypothetical protein
LRAWHCALGEDGQREGTGTPGGNEVSTIDPTNPEFHYRPIWCVYGPDCFPTLFCCKINARNGELTVWGYSVYRRSPGFRTLGVELTKWADERVAAFFAEHEAALAHLAKLTTPRVKA